MVIDYTVQNTYLNVIQVGFCLFCAIFLLILIRPLYNFSKKRTALFILFSKSCANIIYQFLQIYANLFRKFPSFSSSFWSYFFISPIATILSFSIYIHIIALALNRFHAVFFIFSYQNKWKKSNIKYIIFSLWLIILFWSAVQFIGYKLDISQTGFFSIFTYGIFMYGDLPLLMSIFICTPIYTALLAKFVYDYKSGKLKAVDVNTQKERIRILIVCLVSLIPCPWYIGMYKLNVMIDTYWPNTLNSIIISSIFNTSLTLLQCIEEFCLLIISKDFRKMVKGQFAKTSQMTKVSPIFVLPAKQSNRIVN